ncbi:hypothetical protein IJ556_02715, partial [bacterium]|nr:hypothetical protein [bacterium]
EARDKYDAFQELKEKGYDAIKEKYADDERFQIFEKISKHPDYKASSEEQRQAGVLNRMASALLEDIAIAKGPDKEREIKIEIPSIKPKLSEEEQKLAQDIADGKVEINGWGVDHQHPFQKMDSLAINRVTNAATRIKIDREQGKASAADEAGKSDKADKAEKTNKNDEANKADKADKANKADAENKTSGKSADVDPTKSNDDGEKYGIAHFKDMAPKEQKKALKALVKDLKVKYKEAKKSGTQREINDAKEAYENKKAIYDSMFPNRTMDWVKFGLNLVTGGLLDKFIPSSVDTGARIARTLINASEVGK